MKRRCPTCSSLCDVTPSGKKAGSFIPVPDGRIEELEAVKERLIGIALDLSFKKALLSVELCKKEEGKNHE